MSSNAMVNNITSLKEPKKVSQNPEPVSANKPSMAIGMETPAAMKDTGKEAHGNSGVKAAADDPSKKQSTDRVAPNPLNKKLQPGKESPEKKAQIDKKSSAEVKLEKTGEVKSAGAPEKSVKVTEAPKPVTEAPKPQRTAVTAGQKAAQAVGVSTEESGKVVDSGKTEVKQSPPKTTTKAPATPPKASSPTKDVPSQTTVPKAATEPSQGGSPSKLTTDTSKAGAASKAVASLAKVAVETKPPTAPSSPKSSTETKQASVTSSPNKTSEVTAEAQVPTGTVLAKPVAVPNDKNVGGGKANPPKSPPKAVKQTQPTAEVTASKVSTGIVKLKEPEQPQESSPKTESAAGNVKQTAEKVDEPTIVSSEPAQDEDKKTVSSNSKSGIDSESLKDKESSICKQTFRIEVWKKMQSMGQLEYNLSSFYRIPHFKGDVEAIERLKSLEVFKNAKIIKVNLDKAQENLRLMCIKEGKELIVGSPGLREAVFLQVHPPLEPSKYSHRQATTPTGIARVGTALDFSSQSKADLIIVASVAVDRKGNRIGKGEGFSDLEYALLKKVDGITPNALVITLVHDLQVYDSLPEEIFKPYDVTADIIVTPTQIIEVTPRKKKPDLIWNYLSQRRVNCIPLIKNLLDVEKNNNVEKNIELKDVDTDIEDMEDLKMRKKYFVRKRHYSAPSAFRGFPSSPKGGQYNNGPQQRMSPPYNHQPYWKGKAVQPPSYSKYYRSNYMYPNRTFHRGQQPPAFLFQHQIPHRQSMQKGRRPSVVRSQNRRNSRKGGHHQVDFSIKVEGLTKTLRVRNLKTALYERGVRPQDISWWPKKGIAVLHFAKGKKQTEEFVLPPTSAEGILASLQNFAAVNDKGDPAILKCYQAAAPIKKVNFAAPEVQPI